MNKKSIVTISILFCLASFVFPFMIKTENDSLMSVLSTSFTALAAIATVLTLLIAILLYQKFGIESRFIERQSDKVLELVDLIKGKKINVITNNIIYYISFSDSKILESNDKYFKEMMGKTLLFHMADYYEFITPILNIKRSYWLPNEIKEKMEFFEVAAFSNDIDDFRDEKYARLNFIFKKETKIDEIEWSLIHPSVTVGQYIKSKNELIRTIEGWLSAHCDIKLDLKMREPNQI